MLLLVPTATNNPDELTVTLFITVCAVLPFIAAGVVQVKLLLPAPVPVVVMLPVPNASTLVLVLLLLNALQLTVYVLKLSVPAVKVNVSVIVNAPPKAVVMPVPLIVTGALKLTPLVVTVPVPLNVIVPVADQTVVDDKVKLPEIVSVPVELNVNDEPVVINDFTGIAPDNVIVPDPELESKYAFIVESGIQKPAEPPDVADQLFTFVVSHVPVPPIQ